MLGGVRRLGENYGVEVSISYEIMRRQFYISSFFFYLHDQGTYLTRKYLPTEVDSYFMISFRNVPQQHYH